MRKERSSWAATFVSQDIVEWKNLYRRIYFKKLRNKDGIIVKDSFFMDESAKLRILGRLHYGDVMYFIADDDLLNVEFLPPHGEKNE